MKSILLLGFLAITASPALATEYFVHPDGGTLDQCDGLSPEPYSASANGACALNHIFELLDPQSKTARINGGDIITILNNEDGTAASYEMGKHGPYTSQGCGANNYYCYMGSIPSGTAAQPTVIRGEGWDTGCAVKPELWGSGRAGLVLNASDSRYVTIQCLEITDHLGCIGATGYPDSAQICDRSAPYIHPFADTGIEMSGARDILLQDLMIAGVANGIRAPGVQDVTLERVTLYANYSAGWEGDGGSPSASGTIRFTDSKILFNGCGLIYDPGSPDHKRPHACAGQSVGGYGDGLGTGATGGDWIFENVEVMFNNSDGIDLLYHSLGGTITVRNSRFEGNAGNQLKTSGIVRIENNIINGNCAWIAKQPDLFSPWATRCRAGGSPLSLNAAGPSDDLVVMNNTILTEGDCMMTSGMRGDQQPDDQTIHLVNNVFYGTPDDENGGAFVENACFNYSGADEFIPNRVQHNNIIHMVKPYQDPCSLTSGKPGAGNAQDDLCTIANAPFFDDLDYTIPTNPQLDGIALENWLPDFDTETMWQSGFTVNPVSAASPVVNAGYTGSVGPWSTPTTDYFGRERTGSTDIGAVEFSGSFLTADIRIQLQATQSGTLTGELPLSHPYGGDPWNYGGSESVPAGFFDANPDVVDWVLVGVRSAADGPDVARVAALLKSDGSVVAVDGVSAPSLGAAAGSYHVVVWHRNHLAVVTGDRVSFE